MSELYSASQGSSLTIDATLRDANGAPMAGFDGSETLTTTLWPGAGRAASYVEVTTWVDASLAKIRVVVTAAETAALAPGRYQLLTRVGIGSGDPADAYGCSVDITAFAGSAIAPKVYGDYGALLRYGRSWLRQLQTDDDEAGFAEQMGQARSWFEDVIHAHNRIGVNAIMVNGRPTGPQISGARSPQLQAWLDADGLILTDNIIEACAKKTLSYVCECQIGLGEQAGQYARLARMYASQADSIASNLVIQIDSDGDGIGDLVIDCTSCVPLYG